MKEACRTLEQRRKWLMLKKETHTATPDELAELDKMPVIFYSADGSPVVITAPDMDEGSYENRPQPTFPWTNAHNTDKP